MLSFFILFLIDQFKLVIISLAFPLLPLPLLRHHHPQDSLPILLICLYRHHIYACASCEDALKTQLGTYLQTELCLLSRRLGPIKILHLLGEESRGLR